MGDYITVDSISTGEYTEKHSKFIATLYPCKSEEEAMEILSKHKAKYFDARHNVYAYLLHDNAARFSDDGEPHGTAGKPILDVLTGSGIVDALLVVTRYFGGILLGTGGLVRAYSASAKEAVKSAQPLRMTNCGIYHLTMPYSSQSIVMSLFWDIGVYIINTEFSENIDIKFAIPKPFEEDFHKKLCEISSSKLKANYVCDKILPVNAKK